MKRIAVLAALALTIGVAAAPAQAGGGVEVVHFRATYSIPKDLAEVEDPGELNIFCSGGLYTLVDGTFTKHDKATFVPSEEAWNEGREGASVSVTKHNFYTGLWGVNTDPDARYYLVSNVLRGFYTQDGDGVENFGFRWIGEFIDTETQEVAEHWFIDTERDINRGTCIG